MLQSGGDSPPCKQMPALKSELKRLQPAARPLAPHNKSCAAQHESSGAAAKRLFGIVGDGQSHWQPLVRESMQVVSPVTFQHHTDITSDSSDAPETRKDNTYRLHLKGIGILHVPYSCWQ